MSLSWEAATLALLVFRGRRRARLVRAVAAAAAWFSLVAALSALAVVGRLAFAAIPDVKPTTDIVLFAG